MFAEYPRQWDTPPGSPSTYGLDSPEATEHRTRRTLRTCPACRSRLLRLPDFYDDEHNTEHHRFLRWSMVNDHIQVGEDQSLIPIVRAWHEGVDPRDADDG